MKQTRTFRLRAGAAIGLAASIALISILAHQEVLSYYFNNDEDLPLIEDGRIDSTSDLREIFTSPVFRNIQYVPVGNFYYRPVSILSFSLDYALWGLNPLGFHLTNLLLHTLVSVLVFFIARRLFLGEQIIPWLAAVTFAIHPLLSENVAAIALRQVMVGVLFMLVSFTLFIGSWQATKWRKMLRAFSVVVYAVALLSYEAAFIFPGIIIGYLAIYPLAATNPLKLRVYQAVRGCLPFLVVSAAMVAWRVYLLGGTGLGRVDEIWRYGLSNILVSKFVGILVFPPGSGAFTSFPSGWHRVTALVLLAILVFLALFYRGHLFSPATFQKTLTAKIRVPLALMTLMVLSGIGVLAYMLVALYINKHVTSLETYLYRGMDYLLPVLWAVLIPAACGWALWKRSSKIYGREVTRGVLLAMVWLALPLLLYWLTQVQSPHKAYVPAVPFALAFCAIMVKEIEDLLRSALQKRGQCQPWRRVSVMFKFSHLATLAVVGTWVILLVYLPLVRVPSEWENDGNIARMFFGQLDQVADKLPMEGTVHFYNLPSYNSRPITDYSIKAWLNLRYPGNSIYVVVENQAPLASLPAGLRLEQRIIAERTVAIQTIPVFR